MILLAKSLAGLAHPIKGEPTAAQAEAGNYGKRRVPWRGLELAIENEAGSIRSGTNRKGESWSTRVIFPYGYVCRSQGVDADEVDCYLGPDMDAPMVFIVHQRAYGDWSKYDEDKCMIGFGSEEEACAAFLACYDDPRFLGPVTAMPAEEFVAKVRATKERPAMIKSIVLFVKSTVAAHLRHLPGKTVPVRGHNRANPAQLDMFMDDLAECPSCGHPHKGQTCSNPGCEANPQMSDASREKLKAERETAAASAADRALRDRAHGATLSREKSAKVLTPAQAKAELKKFGPGPAPTMDELRAQHHELRSGEAMTAEDAADARRDRERDELDARRREIETQRRAKDAADDAESARIDALPVPEGHKRHFYTTMQDDNRPPRTAFLAGPFERHAEARRHIHPAREAAGKIDGRHHFHSFGTSSITGPDTGVPPRYGKLNTHLGLPSGDHAAPGEEVMAKSLMEPFEHASPRLLIKAHVPTYTKTDGTVVTAHEDRRPGAQAKPAGDAKAKFMAEFDAFNDERVIPISQADYRRRMRIPPGQYERDSSQTSSEVQHHRDLRNVHGVERQKEEALQRFRDRSNSD